ncbi:ferric reductase [Flindersiella endophytica]
MIALWYASRATGIVALLLLSAVVVFGLLSGARVSGRRWPRFAVAGLHRNLTLLAVAFLVVHASTAVIDTYAGIGWLDILIPFVSAYHPFWLGLGAAAFDLFAALVLSSLSRPWIKVRWWRGLHWVAYVCWPLAYLHGIAMSDNDLRSPWVVALMACCALAVSAALTVRLWVRHPDTEARQHELRERR